MRMHESKAKRTAGRQLVAVFPPWRPGFAPRSGHLGLVMDRVELRQVSSLPVLVLILFHQQIRSI